jgi:hypothetical protein
MRRREFILPLGGAAAWPLADGAETGAHDPRRNSRSSAIASLIHLLAHAHRQTWTFSNQ